jgi:DNA-binding PadR family transcriptional regulator
MSLRHALLGFLNYGPHTGYELKKVFDVSVAHFWNAELSQIYPTLKALETEGLVEMEVEVQADRPNRKVYSITEDGRRELLDWLATPAEPDQVREALLIKVWFGSSLRKDEVISVLEKRASELRERLAAYAAAAGFVREYTARTEMQSEALFWQLTMDAGVKHSQAHLEWIEDTIRTLEKLGDSQFSISPESLHKMHTRERVETLEKLKAGAELAFRNSDQTTTR